MSEGLINAIPEVQAIVRPEIADVGTAPIGFEVSGHRIGDVVQVVPHRLRPHPTVMRILNDAGVAGFADDEIEAGLALVAVYVLLRTVGAPDAVVLGWTALAGALTFFAGSFFDSNQAGLGQFFQFHSWLYLVLIPAISMRLWAEERRNGTIELLMTLPVTLSQSILGKFLASWLFLGLALA